MQKGTNETPLDPKPYQPGETTGWNAAWCSIYEHFGNAILAYAKRQGLDDHSAEDVLQEVMTTLIRSQHGQEARRDEQAVSFQGWLWGVIRNRVSAIRKELERKPVALPAPADTATEDGREAATQPAADFGQREEDQWQRSMLVAAMRKVQERIEPETFAIYTALLRETASAEELSRIHGKDASTIHALKHRCDRMLSDETRAIRWAWQQLCKSNL